MEPGEQGNNIWTLLILEWKLQYQTISNVQGGQGNDIYSADIRMRVHKVRESQEMAYSYKTLIHSVDISPRLAVESLAGLWPQEVTKKFIWTTVVSLQTMLLSEWKLKYQAISNVYTDLGTIEWHIHNAVIRIKALISDYQNSCWLVDKEYHIHVHSAGI